jgi:predicted glycoside hydrolase/deacetylase ChbG (UPF0249 family)
VKRLIVNADDFGHSEGVTRGIAEAHRDGIVTSTSLMVDEPAAAHAVSIGERLPDLSIGLHVCISDELARPLFDLSAERALHAELERQLERFRELTGREPDHLDSHHNVHLLPAALPAFRAAAAERGVWLRAQPPVRYFSGFYGQWDGESHLEHIAPESLIGMLEREVGEGITELGCHPGHVGPELHSTYALERETELRTLCDPRVRARIDALGIELVGSRAAREDAVAAGSRA